MTPNGRPGKVVPLHGSSQGLAAITYNVRIMGKYMDEDGYPERPYFPIIGFHVHLEHTSGNLHGKDGRMTSPGMLHSQEKD
jgi:hypothetical protein